MLDDEEDKDGTGEQTGGPLKKKKKAPPGKKPTPVKEDGPEKNARGPEPVDPVEDLPANGGGIPAVSEAEAWGTQANPVQDGPLPFTNLRDYGR